METLNGIEEGGWHVEGMSSNLGCLHLHWLGEAVRVSPGKETAGGKKKNHRINDFGLSIPLGIFPVWCARSTTPSILTAIGEEGGIPCRRRLGCNCLREDGADKIWSQGSGLGHR